jgi:hypothetical protein
MDVGIVVNWEVYMTEQEMIPAVPGRVWHGAGDVDYSGDLRTAVDGSVVQFCYYTH